jgi:hypothetical protein
VCLANNEYAIPIVLAIGQNQNNLKMENQKMKIWIYGIFSNFFGLSSGDEIKPEFRKKIEFNFE